MPRKKADLSHSRATKPHDVKLRAAAEYYMTGSTEKAAKNMKGLVAARTIRGWKQGDTAFQNHMAQLIEDNEEESRVKYREIIQKGLDALVDRIDRGNVKVTPIEGEFETDNDGNILKNTRGKPILKTAEHREPMTSKDLTYTTGIMIDKNRVSLGQPSRITKAAESAEDMKQMFKNVHKEFQTELEDKAAKVVSVQED